MSRRSAARPRATVLLILLATLLVSSGMARLESDADLLKLMPRGDPHTQAAENASATFRGFYDFVTVFYEIDPAKCARASQELLPHRMTQENCHHMMDEVYIRAQDELEAWFKARMPEARYAIDMANIVKTVNWTNSGYFGGDVQGSVLDPLVGLEPERVGRPRDEAFSMPGTDPVGEAQFQSAWEAARLVDESVDDTIAETGKAGRTLFFFDTQSGVERAELGRRFYSAVDAYQDAVEACDRAPAGDACALRWNVWKVEPGEPSFPVRGVSTLDAHATAVTDRDIGRLAPIVAVAIVATLYLALRDLRIILVGGVNLAVSFAWTAGLMGWLHIPFSALNMTVVPLILGVGIDYGIHMTSEFLEHRSDGHTGLDAIGLAGGRAGVAMLVATVTTTGGLLALAFGPSILMAQLGIVSAIAMAVTFLFTMTLVPAMLVLADRGRSRAHRGAPAVMRLARAVGRHRALAAIAILLLTSLAWAGMQRLEPEPFGNPELNYPEGDRVRDDAARINTMFFGGRADAQTNYLVVEGDFNDPETHRFLDALEANIQDDARLQGFNTATLTRVVRAWVAIDQGTPDAALSELLQQGDQGAQEAGAEPSGLEDAQYPQTREEMQQTLDAIFASPFANFMTILLAPGSHDIGVVAFDTRQDHGYGDVKEVWAATQDVVARTQEETGHRDTKVHLFGNNAISYLFIEKQQPWIGTIGIATFVFAAVAVAVVTRSARATLCATAVMAVTTAWWLGALGAMGIGLSVGLTLPMVFITAIGTDDAIHLILGMRKGEPRARVYRYTGQAVLLTSLTTLVAFAIFSLQTDLLVRRTLMATAVAAAVMWAATMLLVPIFYPVERRGAVAAPAGPRVLTASGAPHAPAMPSPPPAGRPLPGPSQRRLTKR